jgi:hypothetical protein
MQQMVSALQLELRGVQCLVLGALVFRLRSAHYLELVHPKLPVEFRGE